MLLIHQATMPWAGIEHTLHGRGRGGRGCPVAARTRCCTATSYITGVQLGSHTHELGSFVGPYMQFGSLSA